jgi:tetrahydromethanopterin S-methyltransferase subunit C
VTNPGRLLWAAWRQQPTAVTLPLVLIPVGLLGIILGDDASRAFANFGGGTLIRILGLAMLACGILVVTSIILDDATFEVMGLALGVFGTIVYGVGVILGLGTQGLITGPENIGIAVAFLGRIALLLRRARAKAASSSPL